MSPFRRYNVAASGQSMMSTLNTEEDRSAVFKTVTAGSNGTSRNSQSCRITFGVSPTRSR